MRNILKGSWPGMGYEKKILYKNKRMVSVSTML